MADNLGYTPGSGATVATDEVSGLHYQRIKPVWGADGVVTDVSADTPMPTSDGNSQNLLFRILQMLMAPLGYDKSLQRQRGTVIVESGTVTTVSTVTTVTTLSGITNIGGLPAQMLLNHQNLSAWAQCVRARIT
jgi:hypothetical protein